MTSDWERLRSERRLSDQAVRMDRWDRRDWKKTRSTVTPLEAATDELVEFMDTGEQMMADVFALLMKAAPELAGRDELRPEAWLQLAVADEARKLTDYTLLRRFTRGSLVDSALACAQLEPDIETLADRQQKRQQQAKDLQDKIAALHEAQDQVGDLDEMIERWTAEHPDEENDELAEQRAAAGARADALQEEVDEDADQLDEDSNGDAAAVRGVLASGMRRAATNARDEALLAAALWGTEPGQLRRVPVEERLALARKLDNARIRDISEKFGAIHNLSISDRLHVNPMMRDEIVGITVGRDLERVLPSEFTKLRDPVRKYEFYHDYSASRLMQHEYTGTDRVSKGGIILLEDGSLSMQGEPERWAKAFMLNLLDIARQEGRQFHLVHFGSRDQLYPIDFSSPDSFTTERIFEAIEIFCNGGPLRVDQRLATPTGWKPIGAARVGDEVFGPDGKPTTITGVFPQGILDLYRVTFSDGAQVICDGSHRWTVDVSSNGGRQMTLTLDAMLRQGLRYTHAGGGWWRFHVPITKPIECAAADLPLDPYLVGYLLGDGTLCHSIPKITAEGSDLPWVATLPAGVTVTQYETRESFCPQYGLKGPVAGRRRNPVTEGLRQIGLWGVVDEDKYIPDEYLWASPAQRWALLQGLCDSDGSLAGAGRAEFTNISEKLAHQVVHLVQSLGHLATITAVQPTGKGRRPCWRVGIQLTGSAAPFRLQRKAAAWRPRTGRRVRRAIISAERVPSSEAICIKVDRDDGLFLTEGMVVTHNTDFQAPLTMGVERLREEFASTGRVSGDIVMLTDGQCGVSDQWLSWYREEQAHLGFRTWGISIGGYRDAEPLWSICDGKVATVKDFAGGGEVREIWKNI